MGFNLRETPETAPSQAKRMDNTAGAFLRTLQEQVGEIKPVPWKTYKPKPLPFGIQERMDEYRAYPSRGGK